MAITSIKTGSSFTNLKKYNDFLAGNTAYIPPSFESIATFSPTSGSSVTFSSIPGTYNSLQVRISGFGTAAARSGIELTYNSDTTGSYIVHHLYGNGTTVTASGSTAQQAVNLSPTGEGIRTLYPWTAIVDIIDYASTTKYKTTRSLTGSDANGTGMIALNSCLWIKTAAISSIKVGIVAAGDTFASGTTIALYGIKG